MKKITLFIGLLAFNIALFGQSFKITDSQGTDITNSKHTISGSGALLDESWGFQNLTMDSVDVLLKRIEITTIPGTEDYFCWGDCFPSFPVGTYPTWYALEALKVGPNQIEPSTHVYFVPNNIPGKSTFLYVYYDENNPNDSAYVELEFDVATYVGINDNYKISGDAIATPNPANDYVKIKYNLQNTGVSGASLVIVDLLGKEQAVYRLNNNTGSVNINTSDFKSGIYFYTIRTSDQVLSTKKLIIN